LKVQNSLSFETSPFTHHKTCTNTYMTHIIEYLIHSFGTTFDISFKSLTY